MATLFNFALLSFRIILSLTAEKLVRAQPCYQCYLMLMCQSACSCRVARRLGLLLWWAIVLELCRIGLSKEFAVHFFISHRQVMWG